jgi:2-methylisocitrate lyase-like PEP mutase family enzyme
MSSSFIDLKSSAAERFRAALAAPGIIALPGCYDALSALLFERAGFGAVFVSGYGVAASLLGNPDIGLTSLNETIAVARNIVASVGVPVVLDLDNGYGNEDSTRRAIIEAEAAGVAAVQLEDQVLPKRCGHAADKRVCDVDTYLRKLDYALRARQRGLVIIARSDATDIDEAIARAKRYRAEGADATIVDGLRSAEDVRRVADEVPGPKQINLILGGRTPMFTNDELEALGFKIVLYSTPALYVAAKAMMEAMQRLRQTGALAAIEGAGVSFSEFQSLMEEHYTRRKANFAAPEPSSVEGENQQPTQIAVARERRRARR